MNTTGNFSLHPCIQNGSGAHPTSWPMGTRGSFHGVEWLGHEADHSPLSSARSNNVELYLHFHSQYSFMVWCSVKAQGLYMNTIKLTTPYLQKKSFHTILVLHNKLLQQYMVLTEWNRVLECVQAN